MRFGIPCWVHLGTLLGPFWGHKTGPGAVSNTRLALKEFVAQIWPPLNLILAPLGTILGAFVSSGCPFWSPFGVLFATQNSSGRCLRFWAPFCVPFCVPLGHFLGPLWRTNVWWTKKLQKKGARREPALWTYIRPY